VQVRHRGRDGVAAHRLENPARDNTIEHFYNGNPQGFYSVAFTQGGSWSYSEHHSAGENLVVDWSSLRYLGNAGNWNLWPRSRTGLRATRQASNAGRTGRPTGR
jgi:hypothetical protein